jgi:hypothetical protein
MLPNLSYSAVMLQTGAAFLQVAAPMTADRAAWNVPADGALAHQVWSDRMYQFNFVTPQQAKVEITEEQSRMLHKSLIASFDEFVPPIFLS